MGDWQPAGTAPKDGTLFIAMVSGSSNYKRMQNPTGVGVYHCFFDASQDDFVTWHSDPIVDYEPCAFDFWMPMPRLPTNNAFTLP